MVDQKSKILSYRRAIWLDDSLPSNNLEKLVRAAAKKLATAADRQVNSGDGRVLSCSKLEPLKTGGVFVHVTAMTPGESASLVKTDSMSIAEDADVFTLSPPSDSEWLDGDVFLLIVANNVIICANSMRDGTIRHYLFNFIAKAKLGPGATQFDIRPVAAIDKVKLIKDSEIKSISINAAMYEASNKSTSQKGSAYGAVGAAVKHLSALIGRPNDVTNDSLNIGLTIKLDGRSKKHIGLGAEKLHSWALSLASSESDDSEYVIILSNNKKITPDELKISKNVTLPVVGKSVDRAATRKVLVEFFNELSETGAVEE